MLKVRNISPIINNATNYVKKIILFSFLLISPVIFLVACSQNSNGKENTPLKENQISPTITVKGDGIDGELTYTMEELKTLSDGEVTYLYSAINNWPSKKTYVAKGVKVINILKEAGVLDTFQQVTFTAPDGYNCTLTRNQLLQERYYFPHLETDNPTDAQLVDTIIADLFLEDATNLEELMEIEADKPSLIFGQGHIFEHNTPAFVQDITQITVSDQPAEQWEIATTFPVEGTIDAGENVKLQHPQLGLVKLYYTLDGTEPTIESNLFNPSTYQPELNLPIEINADTVIKVLVTGYGRKDSDIAVYQFKVAP